MQASGAGVPAGQLEILAYDPWGKRRFEDGKPDPSDSIVGKSTDRGYTEHQHLDEVGVIHMNGRVYDPLIGRFMSADPFVQYPYRLQSYNRYAYVLNNPMRLVDPSGFLSGENDGPRDNSYTGLGPESMSDLGRDASDGGFTTGGLNTVTLDVSRVANAPATELGSAFAMPEQTTVVHDDRLLAMWFVFTPANPAVMTPIVGPAAVPCGATVLDRPFIKGQLQPTLPSFDFKPIGLPGFMINLAKDAANHVNSALSVKEADDSTRKPAPALPDDPYSPGEVDRRRSQTRDQLGAPSNDPDSPIPDQGPGKDMGGHDARGRTPNET